MVWSGEQPAREIAPWLWKRRRVACGVWRPATKLDAIQHSRSVGFEGRVRRYANARIGESFVSRALHSYPGSRACAVRRSECVNETGISPRTARGNNTGRAHVPDVRSERSFSSGLRNI